MKDRQANTLGPLVNGVQNGPLSFAPITAKTLMNFNDLQCKRGTVRRALEALNDADL